MKRIRADLAGTKRACGLGSYIRRKAFPLEEYFISIDELRPAIKAARERLGKEDDDDETLLAAISSAIDDDKEFLAYVLDETNYAIDGGTGGSQWKTACNALAWTIIAEYDKHVEEGRWPIQ